MSEQGIVFLFASTLKFAELFNPAPGGLRPRSLQKVTQRENHLRMGFPEGNLEASTGWKKKKRLKTHQST